MAAVTRLRPLARYRCCSKLRSRISPRRLKNTARASALRASPLFSPACTRRRNSTLCSQSRMNSVRSIQPSSRSATARPSLCPALSRWNARFGASMDVSKADYMIGVDMARKGFSPDQIGGAIEQASPEQPTRKAGHEADYVARTVKAVFTHPEAVKYQQEQAKEAQQRSSRREKDSGPNLG